MLWSQGGFSAGQLFLRRETAERGDGRICLCLCKMSVSQRLFHFALLGFFDKAAPQVVFQIEAFADGFENHWERVFLLVSLPLASLLGAGERPRTILRGKKAEVETGY